MLVASITTLGKTVLLVVAITFIVWSLYTALRVPKKHPGFPRRLDLFLVLSGLLFVAQMSAVIWVTGTQEVEHETAHESGEPAESEGDGEGETTERTEEAPAAGDPAAGKEVFDAAGCASCHTLVDHGATGSVGPNLDELQPSAEQVAAIVASGRGVMPSFSDSLSETDIANVAAYVSTVAGK